MKRTDDGTKKNAQILSMYKEGMSEVGDRQAVGQRSGRGQTGLGIVW